MRLIAAAFSLLFLTLGANMPAAAQAPPAPANPAQQTRFDIHVDGVSAVQLAWWFQHIADDNGRYWKPLAPTANKSIEWRVNPREDAHQLIGALFTSEQATTKGVFPGDVLRTQAQFHDYVTNRKFTPGQAVAINPTLAAPDDYVPPYPSPIPTRPNAFDTRVNGFNQQILLTDGMGFAPGRLLWSWKNTGGDDTAATAGKPASVDLTVTLYQPWMAGANRPPALKADGYYYSPAQVNEMWRLWSTMIKAMPANLPGWFNANTQDAMARAKGFTVTSVIDTGLVEGVDSKMMVWWWNHAMGDAPGNDYSFWCPPAHYAIRWLPGFSPADVLKSPNVPNDRVVPGIIYPDLQGNNLAQDGGGMMAYPPEMSPIPGIYKTLDPMTRVSKAQVDAFGKGGERYPQPGNWLLHQWEDTPQGLVHRSTVLARLPLAAPVTQQAFYSEHQLMEGQFWGSTGMRKSYAQWLAQQTKK